MTIMSNNHDLYAALDLGSNSFHLLVARFQDGKLHIVDRYKDMLRLAAGLDENNFLSQSAQDAALRSLEKMANRLEGVPKNQIRVVGTNTLRTAENASEFMSLAEATLGVPINIISGTEEARLVYLGTTKDFTPDENRRLVIDIGGGSTEVVCGQQEPLFLESLEIGCVSASKKYFSDNEISSKRFNKAQKAARQQISPYISQYIGQWDEAVGASGTIRSIGAIVEAMQLGDAGHITADSMEEIKKQLLSADNIASLNIPGLSDERRDVFPGGFAVLYGLFQELEIKAMHVSNYAVREGVIYDLAGRISQHHDKREQTIQQLIKQYHIDSAHGDRIATLCLQWLPNIAQYCLTPVDEAESLIRWAAQLHELGVAIAHGAYHKHGAYVLSNADMPGFSRQEQARLSFLVLNHRRKPKLATALPYGVEADWLLVSALRIACICYRRRQARPLHELVQLKAKGPQLLQLSVNTDWLDANPLTAADLEDEIELLRKGTDIKLSIRQLSN